jgi:hypothetical protein
VFAVLSRIGMESVKEQKTVLSFVSNLGEQRQTSTTLCVKLTVMMLWVKRLAAYSTDVLKTDEIQPMKMNGVGKCQIREPKL